jgi:cytochrome bd ubiquinol oxidase subunit II
MDLNLVWFLLITILLIGYAILDGFDLGVGILSLFARDNQQKRIYMNAIGPVWDGNEVWLLTGGGALFAAFPAVYATVFSGFYLALMLLLFALIVRAVAMEFRGKVNAEGWRTVWDWGFGLGSLLPALLLGVAYGNILHGVPLERGGIYAGTFLGLLNPYAFLLGILTVSLFTMHGAIYLTLKTEGSLRHKLGRWASRLWIAVVTLYALATVGTIFAAPFLFVGMLRNPLTWLFALLLLGSAMTTPVFLKSLRYFRAFLASSGLIAAMIGLSALSLFPRLVPSSIDLQYSLTVYNASSSPATLTAMLIIALLGMPLVIGYTVFIYRVFKGKVEITPDSY